MELIIPSTEFYSYLVGWYSPILWNSEFLRNSLNLVLAILYFIDNMEWKVHDHSMNNSEACWMRLDDDAPIKASNVPTYKV